MEPFAARMVSFIEVPSKIADELQKDSPFPEVLALNAAARRSRGQYIGRIDQDTLVGKHFIEMFFKMTNDSRIIGSPLQSVLLFANQRNIPYRFAVRRPSLWVINLYVQRYGSSIPVNYPVGSDIPFYMGPVGIWLLHHSIWEECGGYDERFIYMGYMEIDMIHRLSYKYKLIHLEDYLECDFYHLEHYHPFIPRIINRKINRFKTNSFHPNDENWGLIQYPLQVIPYSSNNINAIKVKDKIHPPLKLLAFNIFMIYTKIRIYLDNLILSKRSGMRGRFTIFVLQWWYRWRVICDTVYGKPLETWTLLLKKRWADRKK